MEKNQMKGSESTVIIDGPEKQSIRIEKPNMPNLHQKNNLLDSINTIQTSFISFKGIPSLRRSLSEEDISLYLSGKKKPQEEREEVKVESQKISAKISTKTNKEEVFTQRSFLNQKEMTISQNVTRKELEKKVEESLKEQKQEEEKIFKVPKEMEETIENIISHLESSKENFENFDRSQILEEKDLTKDQQQDDKKEEEKTPSLPSVETDRKSESSESVGDRGTQATSKRKGNFFNVRKTLFLFSVGLNMILLYFLLSQNTKTTRQVQVKETVKCKDENPDPLFSVTPKIDVHSFPEYQDLVFKKEKVDEENKSLKEVIQSLADKINVFAEEKVSHTQQLSNLVAENTRYQQRFSELEANLRHTIELISELKKHLPSSLGDALGSHFKKLVKLVGKIL